MTAYSRPPMNRAVGITVQVPLDTTTNGSPGLWARRWRRNDALESWMPASTAVDGSRPVWAATERVIAPITAPPGLSGGTNRAQPCLPARAENEADIGRQRSVWQPMAVTSLVKAPHRRHAQYWGNSKR